MPRGGAGGTEAVYSLLGYAFHQEFGLALPKIEKTANGKPFFPECPDVCFSLSHARTHVLCALSGSPVGVDIESPREISSRAREYYSSGRELEEFDALDLWVLKESYIKMKGATLALLKGIRFARTDEGGVIAPEAGVITRLYKVEGCRAAVSSSGEPPPAEVVVVR